MLNKSIEKIYTPKSYLAFERKAKNKHEYYQGNIVKKRSTSFDQNMIAANVVATLHSAMRNRSLFVLNSSMKICIPQMESFVYPDALLALEKPVFYGDVTDAVLNPLLIVEFRKYSDKFSYYKTLPYFKEYVLIEQEIPRAIASYKIAERIWKDTEATSLAGSLHLQSIDYTLDMKNIYHSIEFRKPQ